MSLVRKRNFEEVFNSGDFWVYEDQICRPMCALSTRSGSKILGVSELKNFHFIVHYAETKGYVRSTRPINSIFPQFYCINSIEIDQEGNTVFLAGLTNLTINSPQGATPGYMMVAACSFEEDLPIISWMKISNSQSYGLPTRLKRVKGTNILIVGCKGHVIILNYFAQNFKKLNEYQDIHENQICDFEFDSKNIYSKAIHEDKIKIIELGLDSISDFRFPSTARVITNRRVVYHVKNKVIIPMECEVGVEKIVVGDNGRVIFVGGDGLNIFKYEGGKGYRPFHNDWKRGECFLNFYFFYFLRKNIFFWIFQLIFFQEQKFFSLRATTSSHAVIQECKSNNLAVIDKYGRVQNILQGYSTPNVSSGKVVLAKN